MVDLFNNIYKSGIIPQLVVNINLYNAPKKRENDKHFQDCQTIIRLMGHTLKAFLMVINNRIYRKLEKEIYVLMVLLSIIKRSISFATPTS